MSTYGGRILALSFVAGLTLVGLAGAQSSRPGMGSIPYADENGTGVTFRVWAPNASSVSVKGQFNGWASSALTLESGTGHWSRDVAGAQVGQEYKYTIDGADHRDPRARRVTNSNGNSIIYDPFAFDWGGVNPVFPWKNDLVIYEMHVGTFNAESWVPNTFDQALERIDHLVNLGVSAVQVMPIAEFAGDKSWGYNPADPYAVESALGGADAFKRFVKACHEHGIGVFVDVVHNHYGPSDLSLWKFDGWGSKGGIYFYNDSRSSTMWGDTRPDYGRAEVRSFISDNIRMFLEEYKVDGFRWDSVWSIIYANSGSTHLPDGEQMLRDINWMIKTEFPGATTLAEDNAYDFSMNFDSQWDVPYAEHIAWQVTQGSDSDRNMQWLSEKIGGWNSLNRVVYSESHDTVGAMNGKHRLPRNIDSGNPGSIWARKRQLLAAGVVMTTPGIPMIFQGQEMNEDYDFAAETSLRWSLTNTYKGIVRSYADLIGLRRNKRGGTQGLKGTGVNVHHKDDSNKVISYVRWDAGGGVDDVVVVANFSVKTFTNGSYQVEFPSAGTWYRLYNGDSTNYASDFGNIGTAPSVTASGNPPKAGVDMGMYSLQIFSKYAPSTPGSVSLSPAMPTGCVPVQISYSALSGPLSNAAQVVASVGVNGWQGSGDVTLTKTNNQWVGTYSIPVGTYALDLAFHNGAVSNWVWDNNLGADWHFPVAECATIPSSASVSPATPQGCVPVTITYTEGAGSLLNASNVVLYIGRNGWKDIEDVAMTESPPGVWSAVRAIPDDTWQLDFVFHNGAVSNRVWDNRDNKNWRVYVINCVDSLLPSVTITNPSSDIAVSNGVAQFTVRGTIGPGIIGHLRWTNDAMGTSGLVPATSNWAIPSQSLVEGINLIRVSGTNSSANPNAASRDSATNATYDSGWNNGQDGGVGWGGGWQITSTANSGVWLASTNDATNLKIGPRAWALWANSGGFTEAIRPLAGTLNVGDVLQAKFQNTFIVTDASTGVGLQNRFGQTLVEFYFVGGSTNYVVNDAGGSRGTGIPWTSNGFSLSVELTTPTTYELVVNSNLTFTGELKPASETAITRFRAWNYTAGAGGDHNVYLTDIRIDGPAQLQSSVYQSDVTITRQSSPFSDSDGDGYLNWEEEFAGTDPNNASSHPPNMDLLAPATASYIEIKNSSPNRWYDLSVSTNLLTGEWAPYGVQRQGNGGSVWLDFTTRVDNAFYRMVIY
ncbi:MAG: alpha-amylase family glycosyl hydrolase [Kiritimatiellae bacterium]|nr:alpha-amylase family glycosyl hydrolase [Kiritimatiellia bacterium]